MALLCLLSASLATLNPSHTSGSKSNPAGWDDVHYSVSMTNLTPCVPELKLKFKHASCNISAAPQAQTVDSPDSAALVSSPLSSPTMPYSTVPTPSQQNHFMWLRTGGRGSLFSQTLCVYTLIPQKKFTSTRKVLGDLATSQTCSVFHSRFPQGCG